MRIQIITLPNKAFRQLAKRYSAAPKKIDQDLEKVVKETLSAIHINVYNEAPVRTGKLRSAIKWSMLRKLTGRVFVDQRMKGARYEPFVRTGAAPHEIYPRKANALWWPARPSSATGRGSSGLTTPISKVGPPVTRKHPGQKANPYFARGFLKSKDAIRKAKDAGINIVVKNLVPMFSGGKR